MNESKEIKIRPIFRILAGIVVLVGFIPAIFDPVRAFEFYSRDFFDVLGITLIIPLFMYCAIKGKVPDVIVNNVDEETLDDINHTEKFFKEFSPKTIGFVIVASLMIGYVIFKNHFI